MIPQRRYVPEIHDVCPPLASRLDALLEMLPDTARPAAALLVVPNWAGDYPLHAYPDLVDRLKAHPGEKVLHGFTHTLGPDWWNWLAYGTEQHAEFARLSEDDAAERIIKGVIIYERCLGTRPRWFCAPRWRQNAGTAAALARSGLYGYMLKERCVTLDGRSIPVPAFQFDEGRRRMRRAAARYLRARQARRLLAAGESFRLVLHPSDLDDRVVRREIADLIGRLHREGWTPLPFGEALSS